MDTELRYVTDIVRQKKRELNSTILDFYHSLECMDTVEL
jgi:hypothetical protein